ncbi:MAG: hypothetical protein JNL73_03625 [Anaerolineales bacterium]|nr:hypothetical protein [Anaerolineales bacterium]
MTMSKWGGLASLTMAAAYIIPALIYLMGDLRAAFGPLAYSLADLLAGPVWAASLVVTFWVVRTRIGGFARQRMAWATGATWVAAAAMVAVACIRSANRHYHLAHPDLHLEDSTTVLVVWSTLVAGVLGAGWHFWGWSLVLLGAAGWATRRLPLGLSTLYIAAGIPAWFVYVAPDLEGGVVLLGVLVSVWQAVHLIRDKAPENHASASVVA